MFPFRSHHGSYQNYWSHQNGFVEEPNWPGTLINGEGSIMSSTSSASKVEMKSTSDACKSHKEAERRRRQRINSHLSTLRTLLPNTVKTDKASLLAEVVHHVKELRSQATDVAERDWNSCSSSSSGSEEDSWPFPGETDELTLTPCSYNGIEERRLIKATLCCEDRPGLNRELTRAISLVRARAVRAEMMTVGGRTKTVVVIEWVGGGGGNEEMAVLQRALKDVVENRASGYGLGRIGSVMKRARVGGLVDGCDHHD